MRRMRSEWPPSSKKLSWRPTRSTSQHLRPDAGQRLLRPRPRRLVALARHTRSPPAPAAPCGPACRWRQRQRVQLHERRRHHVLRQRCPQGAAQRSPHRVGAGRAPQYATSRWSPGWSSRASTTASRTPRVLRQARLDLPQLDAEAADLHLLVVAPQVLEVPVGPPARQIPASGTAALPPPGRTGRHEPLAPSAPAGSDSRAPRPPRRRTARPPRRSAPARRCASRM